MVLILTMLPAMFSILQYFILTKAYESCILIWCLKFFVAISLLGIVGYYERRQQSQ